MIFAAAAEGLGGVYGTVAMERALAFSPRARAERRAHFHVDERRKAGRSLPTGGCKKWLEGHVVSDQTLSLIAELHPLVARRMQRTRDCELVKALAIGKDDCGFVERRLALLAPQLLEKYLCCMASGECTSDFAYELSARLLHLAMAGMGLELLITVIALDRQFPTLRKAAATNDLDKAFTAALTNAALAQAEISFSKVALNEVWLNRKARRTQPSECRTDLQLFLADRRKMAEIMTKPSLTSSNIQLKKLKKSVYPINSSGFS